MQLFAPLMHPAADIAPLLATWIRGWALVRGLPAPVAVHDGAWKVDVGLPDQLVRYVIPDGKPELVAQLSRELRAPATWLKICAAPDAVTALLPSHWEMSELRYFMRTTLVETANLSVPSGFALSLTETGAVTRAVVTTNSGQIAADGNLIMLGRQATFDQIGTGAAFRRRGLGRLVMQSLANHAKKRGAAEGLLVATAAGQQLYLTLDWQTLSPYTSAFIPALPPKTS